MIKNNNNLFFINNKKIYELKQTQTDEYVTINEESSSDTNSSIDFSSYQDKNLIEDLKINLKVKENIIESVNDALVLKEAEIARLKTRIGLMDRKKLINELNDCNISDDDRNQI